MHNYFLTITSFTRG